jgi:CDGSH-type Zn-finger protein
MSMMADANVTPSENGPYLVSGEVLLTDVDGRDVPHGDYMALCRCGRSKNKPFCDGMHVGSCFDGTLER